MKEEIVTIGKEKNDVWDCIFSWFLSGDGNKLHKLLFVYHISWAR